MAHHDGAERRVTILTLLSLSPTSVIFGAGARPLTAQTLSQNFRPKNVCVNESESSRIIINKIKMINRCDWNCKVE